MVTLRTVFCAACSAALSSFPAVALAQPEIPVETAVYESGEKAQILAEGLAAYNNKDYGNATILLREALAGDGGNSDVHYMLIMSEMYGEDYASVISDCNSFASSYPDSPLLPNVNYQKGKALHYKGDNDQAVMVLSDFCHENPKSPVYPSALYWIADCFYEDYNFQMAEGLFQRIIDIYPDDRKAVDAKYKIDAIAQREREQKLLDMLKANNDRFLEQKASYERQLKGLEGADVATLKKELNAANARIRELEALLASEKAAADSERANAAAWKTQAENARVDAESARAQADAARAQADAELAAYKDREEAARKQAEAAVPAVATAQAPEATGPAVPAARSSGVSEQELLELKLRAAQLQRLLDEKHSASRDNKSE
ncbi:MAG: tetratricopeptide repeat protein [Treponema sp.]|nr:tetratricopeptide repeat protein [Treponema sp.]